MTGNKNQIKSSRESLSAQTGDNNRVPGKLRPAQGKLRSTTDLCRYSTFDYHPLSPDWCRSELVVVVISQSTYLLRYSKGLKNIMRPFSFNGKSSLIFFVKIWIEFFSAEDLQKIF